MPKDRGQVELVLEEIKRVVNTECLKDLCERWDSWFFRVKKDEFDIRIAHHGSDNGANLVS